MSDLVYCVFCHATYVNVLIFTLKLHERQGTPCSEEARYLKNLSDCRVN